MSTLFEYRKYLEREYNAIYREMLMSLLSMLAQGEITEFEVFNRISDIYDTMESRKYNIISIMNAEMTGRFLESRTKSMTFFNKEIGDTSISLVERKINRASLDALLREKKSVVNRQFGFMMKDLKNDFNELSDFMTLINAEREVEGDLYRIGRRIVDDIREIGLNNIQRKLVTGASWNKTEKTIFNDLRELGKTGKITVGDPMAYVKHFGKAKSVKFPIKIKAFEKLDDPDNFYFHLRTRSGRMRWFNARDYSNLVSITTAREANWLGEIEGSVSVGNYLVAFNYFGVNYTATDDPCSAIDGQIFSLKKGYQASNGKIYPYLFDSLPKKPYLLPHPRCRHTMFSIIDNVRILERYDKIAAGNKFGKKPMEEAA